MRSFNSREEFSVNNVGGIHGTSRWQSAEIRLYFMVDPLLPGSLRLDSVGRRREVVRGSVGLKWSGSNRAIDDTARATSRSALVRKIRSIADRVAGNEAGIARVLGRPAVIAGVASAEFCRISSARRADRGSSLKTPRLVFIKGSCNLPGSTPPFSRRDAKPAARRRYVILISF